jgi:hypothetical protein
MRGESAYLATRTGCVAVIGRMPQFHADKLPVLLKRIPASSCQLARSRSECGVPRSMKMGTTPSRSRYDVGAYDTPP